MKKTNIYLIICFLMIGAFINSCDIADGMIGVNDAILNNRSAPVISVIGGGSYAFTDADKTLELKIETPQSGYTYYWSTTAGTIESEGVTVTYTAPEAEGDAVVTCYGARDEYVETKTAQKTIHNIEILTNNMLWFKADSLTGMQNLDYISEWNNSGTNPSPSLITPSPDTLYHPIYASNSLNNKPVVKFLDANNRIYKEGITGDGFNVANTQMSWFIVFRVNSPPSTTRYIFSVRNGSTNTFPRITNLTNGSITVYHNAASTNIPIPGGSGVLLSSVSDMSLLPNTSRVKFWLNRESLSNSFAATGSQTINRIYLGGLAGNSSFTGDIAEIIMYKTALSDERRQQIEAYLTEKWGL